MNLPNPRKGKDGDGGGNATEDLEVLRKEYRNMQANRNAFAHESDLVRITSVVVKISKKHLPLRR